MNCLLLLELVSLRLTLLCCGGSSNSTTTIHISLSSPIVRRNS
ncbi:hypothetical protein LINPERHAP2_LOCUS15916, partial [Linum perenne]